ncbi:ribulose-phosphate 3-epimerase [Blautia sp. MCC289]|nr:ribulose-phosphate 3-epimerase [Blautia sp. MCC289]
MYQLSPSILAADFNCLGEQIRQVEEAGVEWLHIDVMDGAFVPSISFGMPVIASIRKNSSLFFDVHLMIEEPGRYIEEFKKSGADMLTVHAEACKHLDSTLREIRKAGMKVGVAINPGTPVSQLECVLDLVDMVLVMTVNPGFGGQSYIESCTGKVQKLRQMITDAGLDVDIQVDGGINEKTIDKVLDAGANILVAGSAVFGGNIEENVQRLKERMERR